MKIVDCCESNKQMANMKPYKLQGRTAASQVNAGSAKNVGEGA